MKIFQKKSLFFLFLIKKKINFFLAIMVPRPIWSMLAKIWGGLGPLHAGLGGDKERTNST
jgi:hypothetical protein